MATLPSLHPAEPLASSDDSRLLFTAGSNLQVVSTALIATAGNEATAAYATKFFAMTPASASGVALSADGAKAYSVSGANTRQYDLTTPWDISTAVDNSKSYDSTAEGATSVTEVRFNETGDIMYLLDFTDARIYQYTLADQWVVTTATYASKFKTISESSRPTCLFFKPGGLKMYVGTNEIGGGDNIYQYTLSTAWDVSTASYDSVAYSASGPIGLYISPDGTRLYYANVDTGVVQQVTLNTPWDLSSTTNIGTFSTQTGTSQGVWFKPDGSIGYVINNHTTESRINQYTFDAGIPTSTFVTMLTLSWAVEYRQSARVDDTLGLDIRVMSGATVLAAADAAGTYAAVSSAITSATDVTTGPTAFAFVNTSASAATWAAGQVDLRQRYTVSMAADAASVQVDFVQLTGTYTATTTQGFPAHRQRRTWKALIAR